MRKAKTVKLLSADHPLVVRVRRIKRTLRADDVVGSPACAVNPDLHHPNRVSGLGCPDHKAERKAIAVCGTCPLTDLCLLQELREVDGVEHVLGVRAGLKQTARQALYLTLEKEGLL